MTSLLYSDKEKCLYLKQVDEAFRLFGIDCTIYDVHSQNMYLDDRILDKGIPYKILLQEYVDTRLLANLRWSTIDAAREIPGFLIFLHFPDRALYIIQI